MAKEPISDKATAITEKEKRKIKAATEELKKEKETPEVTAALEEQKLERGKADLPAELKSDTFYIDLRPRMVKLPPIEVKTTINVRYPLLPPHTFVHIFWDAKDNELLYNVEEPILDDTEKELFELIQLGLEEMINISYVKAVKSNILMNYLEKNVQSILIELGTRVARKTYQKIMYYIFRNFVGLNEIEPLIHDYYIEDIECNGLNFPLYIVHRIYGNLKTNVMFTSASYMTDFVEKLAQKAGRYISYAKPLLDGTLPDGSRVNATYTEDITTRGPTFTIRKFTKDPWTPTHLIEKRTASAEVFAYIWMAIENKFNMMIIGETAAGKTTFMNACMSFLPPEARVVSIEDTRELNLHHINWLPAVTRSGFGLPTVMGTQFGEINLFDLLKESFRQNPDYVIVGETRGQEASVLFQGMASGHPSYSTFHASSVETLVKRLETPPISLPASLVEALDIVCVTTHIKEANRNLRRLREIDEIVSVEQALGKVNFNVFLELEPLKDVFNIKGKSIIFEKIAKRIGNSYENVEAEFRRRVAVLNGMAKQKITHFRDFSRIINTYYKAPQIVLKMYGIK